MTRNDRPRGALSYRRRDLTITASCATILASLPLATMYLRWTWLVDAVICVAVLGVVALLVRGTRLPLWAPTVAMAAALLAVLAALFPSHQELALIIPTPGTLRHFNDLLAGVGADLRRFGAPVEDRESFLFLSTLGIGVVAILVDLCAVALRRPAVAGLPMLAVYSVPVAIEPDSVSFLPFVLGAMGFLWLLVLDSVDRVRRFGRRFSGDGRDLGQWEPSPLAAAGQRLGLVGLLLAVAVPPVLPDTTGLLERITGEPAGIAGVGIGASGGVKLNAMLSGELNRGKSLEMVRVTTTEPNPYYLRLAMADRITVNGFVNRPVSGGVPVGGKLPAPPRTAPGTTAPKYRATVEILNLSGSYLPVFQHPVKFQNLDRSWRYAPDTYIVYSGSRKSGPKQKYSFDYVRPQYPPDALRAAGPIDRTDPATRDSLDVPRSEEVVALVKQLTSGTTTEYDRVLAIFNHFSPENGFVYSLSTRDSTDRDAITSFLQNKRGYCIQYAAAMAWMVRQAGYPARVAFGFTRGSANPNAASTLTNYNLHAWTEVYFPSYGWIPFDPTPATGVSGSVSPAWAPNPARPQDASVAPTAGSGDPVAQPSGSAAAGPGEQPNAGDQPGSGAGDGAGAPGWPVLAGLGTVAAILALLAVPGLHRGALRRRRLAPRSGRNRPAGGSPSGEAGGAGGLGAGRAWQELLDSLTDYGIPLAESESPRATANRLASTAFELSGPLRPAAVEGVWQLSRAEEVARYARHPGAAEDLSAAVRAVRAALRAGVGLRVRLRAVLLPASVLRRWRAAITGALGSATTAAVTSGETLTRSVATMRKVFRPLRSRR